MILKISHHLNPEWHSIVEKVIGERIISWEKVDKGTTAEIWHVSCSLGKEYAVRKCSKAKWNTNFINNNILANNKGFLPSGFQLYDFDTYYINTYYWIDGNVMNKYSMHYSNVLKYLNNMHRINGFNRGISSYSNIITEAKEILEVIEHNTLLSKTQKEAIYYSARKVIIDLSEFRLNILLNNRGCLTHGDLKPKNIVIRSIGKIQNVVIDWDKICSVSPEFDVVYSAFTGKKRIELFQAKSQYNNLQKDAFDLSCDFLPYMYLIHDAYYYLCRGIRYEYLINDVFPLFFAWKNCTSG